jgi:hypothetical protein
MSTCQLLGALPQQSALFPLLPYLCVDTDSEEKDILDFGIQMLSLIAQTLFISVPPGTFLKDDESELALNSLNYFDQP